MREMSEEMVDIILRHQADWLYPVLEPLDFTLTEEKGPSMTVEFKTTKRSWVFNPT